MARLGTVRPSEMTEMEERAQITKVKPMGYKYHKSVGIPVPIYTVAEMRTPLSEILFERSKGRPNQLKPKPIE